MTVKNARNIKKFYIALGDHNFDWTDRQVIEFKRLWKEGYKLDQITRYFRRPWLECFLLMLDLIDKLEITSRMEIKEY